MNEKIMGLIQLAMQFTGEITVSVEFASHINAVIVCGFDNGKVAYRETCYLDHTDAEEKLDSMKKDLEEMLKQIKVA